MVFVRRTGDSNLNDPRQKRWAIFKCQGCGHEENYDVTFKHDFDYDTPRQCPQCKTVSQSDYIKALKAKINRLTEQKSLIEIEIDQLIREAEQKENELIKE
jgi:hypothetical protein